MSSRTKLWCAFARSSTRVMFSMHSVSEMSWPIAVSFTDTLLSNPSAAMRSSSSM